MNMFVKYLLTAPLTELYTPRPNYSLNFLWMTTPTPQRDGFDEADAAAKESERKVKLAIQAIGGGATQSRSWLRRKARAWLRIDIAWCRLAVAESMRWAIGRGASMSDLLDVAAALPPIPASAMQRKKRQLELVARVLCSQGSQSDGLDAVAAALELHLLMQPSFDVTAPDALNAVLGENLAPQAHFSTLLHLLTVLLATTVAFTLRAGVAAFVALLFNSLGAQVLAGALAYHLGHLITRGFIPYTVRAVASACVRLAARSAT